MTRTFSIACLLFISSCLFAQKTTYPPKEFYTCWKAAYEENNEKAKTNVFRPCTYTFRPSMFRLEIEFFANGNCKYLQVGAADLHYYIDGKWSCDKKTKTITIKDDKDKVAYKYKIKGIKKEKLTFVMLN
jgi:hypothetical protein